MIRQPPTLQAPVPEVAAPGAVHPAPVQVITATTRLARELGRQFDADQISAGRLVWEPRRILPFSAWLADRFREWLYSATPSTRPPVHLLSPAQERVAWERVIRDQSGSDPLLQVWATADAALEAWNLACTWMLPFDGSEWRDTSDAETFHAWAVEFMRRSDQKGWLSAASLPRFITERIETGELSAPERIVLAGFTEFTPAQLALFAALREVGCSVVAGEGGNRAAEPPFVARPGRAVRVETADGDGEVRAAAAWARGLIEGGCDDDRANLRIGVVVPDLAAYRSRIEREFAETLHPGQGLRTELDSGRLFNISLSPSLAEYPVVDAAFRVLRLRAGQVDIEEAGSLMRSRFLDAARGEYTSRALLDREARKLGEPELPVATLIRLAEEGPAGSSCPRLAALLSRWKKVLDDLPRRHMPGDWVPAFSDLLAAVGWPGEGTVSSVQYQILAAWNELLNEFAGLDRTAGSLTLDRAVDLLERLASSRQFQPESDPAPVQVLGVFEASGLRFDHLWLMGMHDGAWPKSGGPNPFLPLRLQLGSNVPGCSPQRRLQFARAQTRDLFASAGSVVVSYPRRDRDTDLRPSPLVGDLPEPGSPPEVAAPRISWSERLRRSSRMETIEDLFAPPWQGAGAEPARGGTSIFRLQAACPFRAAAQLRLGAEPLASPQPGLSAMDRGLLTHDALDRVWSELGSHEVLISASGEAPARIDDVVERAVEAAIQTIAERRAALRRSRFRNIEGRRLRKLIMEWLAIERQRARFVVISQESAHVVEVGGVKLAIRTDRADRMDDGTEVLIDYKTGEHTPREWNGDRPDEPQLPLYAATTDACLSGVFFGVVRAGRSGFRGECVADGLVPGVGGMGGGGEVSPRGRLGSRVREWGRVLSRLGEEFRRGFAVVDPKTSRACSGCSLTALCRIGDVAGPGQPRRADR